MTTLPTCSAPPCFVWFSFSAFFGNTVYRVIYSVSISRPLNPCDCSHIVCLSGRLSWSSSPDYLCDPAVSRDTFVNVYVCCVLMYAAHEKFFVDAWLDKKCRCETLWLTITSLLFPPFPSSLFHLCSLSVPVGSLPDLVKESEEALWVPQQVRSVPVQQTGAFWVKYLLCTVYCNVLCSFVNLLYSDNNHQRYNHNTNAAVQHWSASLPTSSSSSLSLLLVYNRIVSSILLVEKASRYRNWCQGLDPQGQRQGLVSEG